jgi:hypothetical protein
MIPALVQAIKVAGLIVVSDATGRKGSTPEIEAAARRIGAGNDEGGIDGVLRSDGIMRFWESIDM